jgi:hypothetical protein
MAIYDEEIPVAPEEVWRGSSEQAIDEANFAGPRNEIFATSTDNAYIAEIDAIRRRGEEKYRRLIADGARPEEALLLAAPDLFSGNSRAVSSVLRNVGKPSARPAYEPSFQETPYGTLFRSGEGSARILERKESPEVIARRKMLGTQIEAMYKAQAMPYTGQTVDAKKLAELEGQYWATFPKQTAPQPPPDTAAPRGQIYFGSKEGEPISSEQNRTYFGPREGAPNARINVTAPNTGAPRSPSPFKEGDFVRDKRTNKRYQIVNGVPVLASEVEDSYR